MEIIEQNWRFVNPTFETDEDYKNIVRVLEYAGRRCYQSDPKGDPEEFLRTRILASKHHSVLEHCSVTVVAVTDRGVTHEIVRHRLASYSQESTRYCNYGKLGVKFIVPADFHLVEEDLKLLKTIEDHYNWCLAIGRTPQQARYFLPNGLKTEITMTYNLRQWMHFFALRFQGVTGKPHPQMKALAESMAKVFAEKIPVIFGYLKEV